MSEMPEKPKRGENWLGNGNNQMIAGIALILLGVIFFLQQSGIILMSGNWWAIFILIPGIGLLISAFTTYQRSGTLTREAWQQLVGALFVLAVAGIFIFNLDWGRMWPIFLILAGVAALFGWRE